jgi:phosphate starvation-inducible protein PhoH
VRHKLVKRIVRAYENEENVTDRQKNIIKND